MVQILKNLQPLLHDRMALLALDVSDKAHATGVVLIGRVVQTLLLELLLFGCRGHGASFSVRGHENKIRGVQSLVQCNKNAKLNN
ncbi:hypothetical protein Y695_01156 [Hydrogenophaga sp. T4]|nr:hypothetical protein Y695_01156 [Hydrogenophaga sp. T4]